MNIEDAEGNQSGIDLATWLWQYSILAVEGIHNSCIIFIPQERWGETECLEAKKREISMWEKFQVVECVEDVGQEPQILTKWILTDRKGNRIGRN